MSAEFGILYIVPTPIGNLGDISQRALETLQKVAFIAAEDTRHSGILLSHFGIKTRLFSLHDHNEQHKASTLIERLQEGQDIALISDAGTPLISDPGYHLVNLCRQANIKVVPLPGACAAITALSAAGLPTDRFYFEGFLPAKSKARADRLNCLKQETATMVFYESPRRIKDMIQQVISSLGSERRVVVARELTKRFESIQSLPAKELLSWLQKDENNCRGEFVVMIEGASKQTGAIPQEALNLHQVLLAELPPKKAAAITAEHYGLKRNELYKMGLENK